MCMVYAFRIHTHTHKVYVYVWLVHGVCMCMCICTCEGWGKLCSELFKQLSTLNSCLPWQALLRMSSFTLCLYVCHMVRVSNISTYSSCLRKRVHVSVLYATINSLTYVSCDISLCLCPTCHMISGSCMCMQPATQHLSTASITNLNHFQLKSVANTAKTTLTSYILQPKSLLCRETIPLVTS